MLTIEQARFAVRITGEQFDGELSALMDAAKEDLQVAGVLPREDSPMYDQAVKMYVLAHFNIDAPEAEKARGIYDTMKNTMHVSGRFREVRG